VKGSEFNSAIDPEKPYAMEFDVTLIPIETPTPEPTATPETTITPIPGETETPTPQPSTCPLGIILAILPVIAIAGKMKR
jgi:hypothetical protein